MKTDLIPVSTLVVIEDEPRIRDVYLAERLEFVRLHDIRELIARNREELEAFGNFPCRTEKSEGRGRPGKAYYLNEGQALVVCALSRTPKAAAVRKILIDVFMAYRRGEVVDVKEHRRRLPRVGKNIAEFKEAYADTRDYVNASRVDMKDMLASLLARVSLLEKAVLER